MEQVLDGVLAVHQRYQWMGLDIPGHSTEFRGTVATFRCSGESGHVAVAFAEKLRMSAAALGCTSRKEICARFRAVNPATQCDIDRLNKWVQGRSLPRASSVYEDLAKVIGAAKTGHWVAECSLEDFATELAVLVGADASTLSVG